MKNPSLIRAAAQSLLVLAAVVAVPSVGAQPVFGRITITGVPTPPLLLFPQPLVITTVRGGPPRSPLYLYVPAEHSRNWSRYCYRYQACNQPVYFVRDEWYQRHYYPHHYHREWGGPPHGGPGYRPGYGPGPGYGRGPDHRRDVDHGRDDRQRHHDRVPSEDRRGPQPPHAAPGGEHPRGEHRGGDERRGGEHRDHR